LPAGRRLEDAVLPIGKNVDRLHQRCLSDLRLLIVDEAALQAGLVVNQSADPFTSLGAVLSGYTAAIIVLESSAEPNSAFDTARGSGVALRIICEIACAIRLCCKLDLCGR
jgi:hypothetical protein